MLIHSKVAESLEVEHNVGPCRAATAQFPCVALSGSFFDEDMRLLLTGPEE